MSLIVPSSSYLWVIPCIYILRQAHNINILIDFPRISCRLINILLLWLRNRPHVFSSRCSWHRTHDYGWRLWRSIIVKLHLRVALPIITLGKWCSMQVARIVGTFISIWCEVLMDLRVELLLIIVIRVARQFIINDLLVAVSLYHLLNPSPLLLFNHILLMLL